MIPEEVKAHFPDLFQELRLDYGDNQFTNIRKAIETSYESMKGFRELYKRLVESYAGPAYGTPDDKRSKYINKLAQIVEAYMMLLAANRPQAEINTRHRSLRAFARHFEINLNNMLGEIRLEETVRRWVMDAFFFMGVIKVHLKSSVEVEFGNNLWMDPGTPFASNISPFDFVCDMSVKTWPEVKFAANMYQITVEDLQKGVDMGVYDVDEAAKIVSRSRREGDTERLESLVRDSLVEEYDRTVDLCDVWFAKERKVRTFAVSSRLKFTIADKPIAEMDWEEADEGPYHILGFNDVPDCIMPSSPASHYDELDRLINSLYRKAARQAQRQKEVYPYAPGSANDVEKYKKAPDGTFVQMQDPTKITTFATNGANANNMQFLQNAQDILDLLAGNIPALLGLAQQGDTLGQEELIHTAGNRKIAQMQYRVMDATRRLIKSLGFMLWKDEFKKIVSTIQVTPDYEAQADWGPGDREGNFMDYNFDVNVYSMAYRPPSAQVETVNQILGAIYIPLAQMAMQQGVMIDFVKLTQILSVKLGVDWFEDIIKVTNPPDSTGDGPTDQIAGKSPVTTRNYVRRSEAQPQISGMAKQQQWAQMANQQAGNTGMQ